MRLSLSRRVRLLTSIALIGAAPILSATQTGRAAGDVAFVDVTVVPMTSDTLLAHRTVLVRDGRIARVMPATSARIPQDARRIDGREKFLMPGLAEMHGHLPNLAQGEAVPPLVLALFVANGVTTVRGMLGAPTQLAIRERVRRDEMLGPTLVLSGPAMTGTSAPTPEAGAQAARDQQAAGYDFIKMHEGLSRATYDAIATTADELRFPFAGHVAADVGLAHALERRQSSVEHLLTFAHAMGRDASAAAPADDRQAAIALMFGAVTPARAASLARDVRASGVWVTPTTVLWETRASSAAPLMARDELRWAPRAWLTQWERWKATPGNFVDSTTGALIIERQRVILRALREARVPLLLGSDAPQFFNVPGFSLHREMASLAAAGFSPYEILRGGTSGAAEYLRAVGVKGADFGTVTEGARADLLLLDANPLADVRHVSRRTGVMLRGRWMPQAELDGEMARLAAAAR